MVAHLTVNGATLSAGDLFATGTVSGSEPGTEGSLGEIGRGERWLADGDEPFAGMRVRELHGSKTAGELALVLDEATAIFGDLVRAHAADALMLLPAAKLRDRGRALESLRRFRELHPAVAHVLVGDGWCAFRHGGALLDELLRGSS
jgi:hypothetical protein